MVVRSASRSSVLGGRPVRPSAASFPARLAMGVWKWLRPSSPVSPSISALSQARSRTVKHDGFRILARKQGKRVLLWSRRGADFTYRFPAIAEVDLVQPAGASGRVWRDNSAHPLVLVSHATLPHSKRTASSIADCRGGRSILRRSGAKRGKRFGAGAESAENAIAARLHDVRQNGVGEAEGASDSDIG